MRIIVDTNIAFGGILNTNSKISRIILQPKTRMNFFSTNELCFKSSMLNQLREQTIGTRRGGSKKRLS